MTTILFFSSCYFGGRYEFSLNLFVEPGFGLSPVKMLLTLVSDSERMVYGKHWTATVECM